VVTVPYEALGPEITADYGERTALFAVRDGLLIAGTLAAAASPAIIGALLADPAGPEAERRKFLWMALAYAPLLVGACLLCVLRIREAPAAQRRGGKPRVQDLRLVLRNRPFLILLGSYTVGAFGSNLPATLILYYVEHVLRSERADLFLFLYFVSGILMLPAWIALARRYGKKEAWLVSMAVNTLAFAGVFFLGPGDELAYGLLVVLSGLGFGATLALPSAIQADVIDYDELLSGRRQEGWYIGIWSVFKKLAAALGVGLGLTVLGAAGYVPGAEQPPGVVSALRLLYALLPCLCNLAAIGIALRFPISRRVHGEILAAIEARRAGGEAPDPLRR
jgi:GPH family glycoside/pentoside/hexuronide:cation symporter